MKKIYVIHSTAFDFENDLYKILKKNNEFEFIFPHAKENELKDSRELIAGSDVVLAEVSYPSTGSGIEIGRAECAGVPIVAIFKKSSKVSSALKFVTSSFIEYEDLEKDFEKIRKILNTI